MLMKGWESGIIYTTGRSMNCYKLTAWPSKLWQAWRMYTIYGLVIVILNIFPNNWVQAAVKVVKETSTPFLKKSLKQLNSTMKGNG